MKKHYFVDPPMIIKPGVFNNDMDQLLVYENMEVISTKTKSKYTFCDIIGNGAFSDVYRVSKNKEIDFLAMKVYKSNEDCRKQGYKEVMVLNHFKNYCDDNDFRHIPRIHEWFEYKNHYCIVMQLYEKSLFDLISNDYEFHGVGLDLTQKIAQKIICSMRIMERYSYIHTDLKPENIMISSSDLILVDFGACKIKAEGIESYIQSRYYRAPEVILQMPLTGSIDIWSFGCIIAEVYLGLPIFSGQSEHHMLQLMELRLGKIPYPMASYQGFVFTQFFDPQGNVRKTSDNVDDPSSFAYADIQSLVMNKEDDPKIENCEEKKMLLVDFLAKTLEYDPKNRITLESLENHPFLHETI